MCLFPGERVVGHIRKACRVLMQGVVMWVGENWQDYGKAVHCETFTSASFGLTLICTGRQLPPKPKLGVRHQK